MGRVIAIASGKGGTGKTTITANLGIALAKGGKKTLVIDADVAMANLSLVLGMQSSPITLHDVLLGEAKIQDAVYDGPSGLRVVPSGLSLENYKRVDSERLKGIIEQLEKDYDFILIDVAAGIEKNVLSALSAADETLLVTIPTTPSVADALKTKIVAQRLNSKIIGVVMNFVMHENGEISSKDISGMLELPVFGEVPYDPEVRRSFMQKRSEPVVQRKPDSPAAIEIQKVAAHLMGVKFEAKPTVQKKKGLFSFLFFWKKK